MYMKMKIMYISNESEIGGAAKSLLDMLEEVKKNVEPIVVIPGKGMMEECLDNLNVEYHIVPFSAEYISLSNNIKDNENYHYMDNYEAALKIVSIIKDKKIDVIHSNSSMSNVGAMAAIMTNIPHVWHIREFLGKKYGYDFLNKEMKIDLLHKAGKVISISNCVKEIFLNDYGIDSICLYNGLDLEKYKVEIKNDVAKPEVYNFLMAGSVFEGKGQMEAVKAFNMLIKEGMNNIRLTIIGAQEEQYTWLLKNYIKEKNISNYIQIKSFHRDLSNLRKNTIFSLTCSKFEPLGRVTLEAMLAGNIVIGANSGGTLEIIGSKQERGYLYEQGDYISLANTIKEAINDTEEKKKFYRVNAQKYVMAHFNSKQYVKDILNLYKEVIKGKENLDNRVCLKNIEEKYSQLKKSYNQISFGTYNQEKKTWEMYQHSLQWLRLFQEKKTIVTYFRQKNWKRIAIYGMGCFGRILYDELQESDIEVCYGIDQKFICDENFIKIKRPEEEFDMVDAIVVTVSGGERELIKWLKKKSGLEVISLWEIINQCS